MTLNETITTLTIIFFVISLFKTLSSGERWKPEEEIEKLEKQSTVFFWLGVIGVILLGLVK